MDGDPLTTALEAVVDSLAHAIIDGCAADAALHMDTKARSANLRTQLAFEAALGPALKTLGNELLGRLLTSTSDRAAAIYSHPRMSTDAAIRELKDAETTLQRAILKAQSESPDAKAAFAFASLRVIAITQAVGPACVIANKAGRKGLQQERRKPTADDLPPQIIAIVQKMVQGDEEDFDTGVDELQQIMGTPQDVAGIATKLYALATSANGSDHICTIADNITVASEATARKARRQGLALMAGKTAPALSRPTTPPVEPVPETVIVQENPQSAETKRDEVPPPVARAVAEVPKQTSLLDKLQYEATGQNVKSRMEKRLAENQTNRPNWEDRP